MAEGREEVLARIEEKEDEYHYLQVNGLSNYLTFHYLYNL